MWPCSFGASGLQAPANTEHPTRTCREPMQAFTIMKMTLATRLFRWFLGKSSGELCIHWKLQWFYSSSEPDFGFEPPLNTIWFGGPFFNGWRQK
jgi:hypothetical protein